jgi:predicted DNA-binding protein
MAILAFRVTDEEKAALNSFAEIHGTTMSQVAREIIISRIEDEEDYRAIGEYKKNPSHKTYTMKESGEMLGIN